MQYVAYGSFRLTEDGEGWILAKQVQPFPTKASGRTSPFKAGLRRHGFGATKFCHANRDRLRCKLDVIL